MCFFWITCWENGQLLTSLIHGWVTALLSLHMIPLSKIFDRLLKRGLFEVSFNIFKTLIQQDVSTGVLHVTKSAAAEIHSLQHEMFSGTFSVCDNSKVNKRLKFYLIQHLHVLKLLLIAVYIHSIYLQALIPKDRFIAEDLKVAWPTKYTTLCASF